jgi:putative ABC transport system permease protein
MNLLSLVFINLGRNKKRTFLTLMSVIVALFLFCALSGVLDTLDASIKVGSEARLATRNKISLVFPLPLSYRPKIEAVPGVERVALQNWFGGQDPKDPHNFFAQFGVDDNFYKVYDSDLEVIEASPAPGGIAAPEGMNPQLAAYAVEQNAAIVGEKLMKKMGWKLGQTVTLKGTIYPGDWPFVIRAVYRPKVRAMSDNALFFHWRYLEQKGLGGQGFVGVYVLQISDPARAGDIAHTIDAMFENSAAATRTETERAFQAGFVSMYGNLPFVIRLIGFAVVFAILLVAANTMMMAFRERTAEIGVMKTLGFDDATVFRMVLIEAAMITLGGGLIGALLAKIVIEGSKFNLGGMLPPMTVAWSTVITGTLIAVVIGAVSGLIPAWQASKLRIVQALRRV